ncbi:MAG: hypothetical protein AAF791_14200 [Bacteroidota bacterium]
MMLPRTLFVLLALTVSAALHAQPTQVLRFLDPSGDIDVTAEVTWGNIRVVGYDGDEIRLQVTHTAEGGSPQPVTRVADFVEVRSTNTQYLIRARSPQGDAFESVDLVLRVPSRARFQALVARGGEIRVEGMDGGVYVQNRNGSVDLRGLSGPTQVNAVNGSITASFRQMPDAAMSFLTMNGEVDLLLPRSARANVQLRSERNGYIDSDFALPGVDYPYAEEAGSAEKPLASPRPIQLRSTLNGGGPMLIATTENGPIKLRARR